MKKQGGALRRGVIAALCMLAAGSAGAVSLQQAYEAALKNDPAYRMSYYENEAGKENVVLGRAGLLPSVTASFSGSKNNMDREIAQFGRVTRDHPSYLSRSSVVQMRQPILNLEATARYRQGKVQTLQSAEKFEADTNEVALRVVGAYVDVLFAQDQVALAEVQRNMYLEQQKVNERMFEKGEGTKTDMLETKARLDLAEAQLIEAQDNLVAQRNTLEGIIGMDPGELDQLSDTFGVVQLTPGSFDEWRALALRNNNELAAARLAVENARLEIAKNRAGHYPRVDFVASYSKGDNETINTFGQESTNRAVGVQVNVPIYAGGAISASTRQAAAAYERAQADLEARIDRITVELRKAHSLVQSSSRKIEALIKAVESSKELMRATEQSIKGGVRINLDLLTAQQQLFTSQRDLAQARYSYIVGLLRLRAAGGTLGYGDIREIAAYFR